ncbi:MAG: phage tail sheath subtilisin-like domain-containing protein [Desulfobulbus sp.]|jgi:phage tail sheath gpL-like|uniref:phage tail sheath subtilisin-like domain-containing protein n=1 Tax=Desulfobulbus sp. TaxID=895 RepID=UPI00284B13C7|nr:phage tail sheath subtilisin-like domain-containing protein [Desulfobulbus sp.]MDR2551453.1 phage tail sheath subtilisin-like domain-containing protein [Desulfobulbus sp.]
MASQSISFDSIPSSIRKPGKYFEFNHRLAVRTLPTNQQQMLIVAQRLPYGLVPALVPTRIFSDAQAADAFGAGSLAHRMCRAAIVANPYLQLTVCALDDGAGAAASATVTIAGDATISGFLKFFLGNDSVEIVVTSGDTAAEVAAALKAALDVRHELPVSATVEAAIVTLTARHKGTVPNRIDLACELSAKGTTVTMSGTSLTGGAIDPDLATALAQVYGNQFDVIVTPYNDQAALTALRNYLDDVSGPMEQRPGIGIAAIDGALAGATTLAGQINSGRILVAYLRGTRSPDYEVAAAYGAVVAFEEDPARPLNTLALTGIHAPPIPARLGRGEQESCLANGIAPLEVGPGETVQIVRAITTYTKNAENVADIALLDLTTIRTLDYTRKACRERIALRFPREKLSSRTPKKVRTELLDVLDKLEKLDILEDVMVHKDGLLVERDLQDPNRLNGRIPADVVNGLHVFAGRIDLLL